MAVLDDIRDGKGLKPITSTYFTCQKGMTNIDVLRNASAENFARFLDEYEYHGRTIREWADLISKIPPHGRLIDADALLSLLDKCMFPSDMVTTSAVRMATNWIKGAPTIIEAEPCNDLSKPTNDGGGGNMTHHIKLSHHYADAVLSGQKNFEVRYNDRGYQRGDKVCFQVVDDCKITMSHPLNRETFIITYLVHGFGLEKDWCAFGIKPLNGEAEEDE